MREVGEGVKGSRKPRGEIAFLDPWGRAIPGEAAIHSRAFRARIEFTNAASGSS
jgi:hypothetical protein